MGHTVDSLPKKLSTPHDSTSQWTHRSLVEDCDISIVPWTFTLHSLQSFPGCSEKVIEITDSMMGEESNKQKQDKKISVVKIFPQFYAEPMFSNCCSNFPLCHLGIPALALSDVGCKNASGDQPAHRPVPEAQPQAEINFWSPLPYTRTATASIQFWGLPGDKYPLQKSCTQGFSYILDKCAAHQRRFGRPPKENYQDCDFKQVKQLGMNLP